MKRFILITFATFWVGFFTANAQVDDTDPSDNTQYEIGMDSINQERIIDDPATMDTSITDGAIMDSTQIDIDTTIAGDTAGVEIKFKDPDSDVELKNEKREE